MDVAFHSPGFPGVVNHIVVRYILKKEVRTLEQKPTSPIGPRYSRGLERENDAPYKHERPRFSRGQEQAGPTHEKEHEGEFAVGQERAPHHPEWGYHGRYSRGQEVSMSRAGESTSRDR
jgi:hypothetical protein